MYRMFWNFAEDKYKVSSVSFFIKMSIWPPLLQDTEHTIATNNTIDNIDLCSTLKSIAIKY